MQCFAVVNLASRKRSGRVGVRRANGLTNIAAPFADVPIEPELADAIAAQGGDPDAFVRLVKRHETAVYRLLLRFTNDRLLVQDLCQETYLEAYRSLHTFRNEGAFAGWLRRVAMRVGFRFWARQAREARARRAYAELLRDEPCCAAKVYKQDVVDAVLIALRQLSSCDRELIDLRYFKGLNASEIGSVLGWTVTRVRVRLHRAIKQLRTNGPRSLLGGD